MTEAPRHAGRAPDGVLVLRKPPGPTSHDMVALVRRLTGVKRVGHGGTLDPFASGVLPVFLGLATRLVEYHMADDKAYRATVCFGFTSATDDRDGELVPGEGPAPTREAVEAALAEFRGVIEQRPPAYSALKVGGRRAYELARTGAAPELAPRTVTIGRLELVEWDDSDPERPTAILDVECGAGTYIRSLARDLGRRLGCGAYLGALVRTRSGPFGLDGAHDPDELRAAAVRGPADVARLLLPVDTGLDEIPAIALNAEEVVAASRGQQVKPSTRPDIAAGTRIRILDEHRKLVGMGSWKGGRVVPEKIFVAPTGATPGGGAGEGTGGEAGAESRPRRELPPRIVPLSRPAQFVTGIDALDSSMGRLYVAVGVFDGLHKGHLYLLRELRHAAQRAGARAAVITFDAHPEEIVQGLAPPLLCDPDERLVRLAAAGVEVTVVQHFDRALRETSYQDFVGMIRARVELAGFVMTPDAAFGFERRGTPEALAELGRAEGFGVTVVPSLLLAGQQVRSSEIRGLVAAGDLAGARRLLGRSLSVVGGRDESGRVGFEVPVSLPPDGSYAALLGPPWRPGSKPSPATLETPVAVAEAGVKIPDGGSPPPAERVRIVFLESV